VLKDAIGTHRIDGLVGQREMPSVCRQQEQSRMATTSLGDHPDRPLDANHDRCTVGDCCCIVTSTAADIYESQPSVLRKQRVHAGLALSEERLAP
jgi:hypothetical protein